MVSGSNLRLIGFVHLQNNFYLVQVTSVAKGPKFRPHNSKGALQKFVRPEKLAAEFSLNMLKKGRKGAELF
jgi:hypothetical protein